jgi:hypothetical protein
MLGGCRGEADSSNQEQVVHRVHKSVVLLQGTCARVRARGKSYVSSTFAHVQPGLRTEPPFDCDDDDSGDAAFV